MKRRHFILLSGGAGAGSLTLGTGAFSSVTADRTVAVNVVGDEEAYLGLQRVNEGSVTVAGSTDVLQVRNLFANDLDLTVTVEDHTDLDGVESDDELAGPDEVDLRAFDDPIGPGDEKFVSLDPRGVGSLVLGLGFEGDADGGSVTKTRSYEIEVHPESESAEDEDGNEVTVEWRGNARAKVLPPFEGSVSIRFADGKTEDKVIDDDNREIGRRGGNSICSLEIDGERFDNPSSGADCDFDDE